MCKVGDTFISQSALRQVHSLFHSESFSEWDVVLSLSLCSEYILPWDLNEVEGIH
jgi:hypothetical protein